jgi:hypothetical protein
MAGAGRSGTVRAGQDGRAGSGNHPRRTSPHNRAVALPRPGAGNMMMWICVVGVVAGVLAGVGIILLFMRG